MKSLGIYASLFFLAAGVVLLLAYLPIPQQFLHGIVVLSLVIIVLSFQYFKKQLFSGEKKITYFLIFLISFFIDLLVISTGGIFSHFLLLFFLFGISLSFFINVKSALTFLVSTLSLILFQLLINPSLQNILYEDPGTIILFGTAFVVVVVMTIFINNYYHLKDLFVEVLKKQIELKDLREQSILSNLTELVLITDKQLNIISANEAVERTLKTSKYELVNKKIFATIVLKDKENHLLTDEDIEEKIFTEPKTQLIFDHLNLVTIYNDSNKYSLVAKPILNIDGQVDQLIFTITALSGDLNNQQERDILIDRVMTKQQALIEELKRKLLDDGKKDLVFKAEVIGKIDRELRYLIELENNNFEQVITPLNVAEACNNTCRSMQKFAEALKVRMVYKLINVSDKNIEEGNPDQQINNEAIELYYTVSINAKWFYFLLHKIVEICILLSSSTENGITSINLNKDEKTLTVIISSNYNKLNSEEKGDLLKLDYANLTTSTNLNLASGLEGFIVQLISSKLNIPLSINTTDAGVEFVLNIPIDN